VYLTKSPIFIDHVQLAYVHNSLKVSIKQHAAAVQPSDGVVDPCHNTQAVALINSIVPVTDVSNKRSDFQSSSPMI
jgi:hypothetical protein